MFDIGMTEMLVIVVLAVVVVGPKDLPKVMRTMARAMAKMRGLAREFQSGMSDLAREAELDTIRDEVKSLTQTEIPSGLGNVIDPGIKPEPVKTPDSDDQDGLDDQDAVDDPDAAEPANGADPDGKA